VNEVVGQLVAVLQEALEGPKEVWSYFTDNHPDAGFLGTLSGLGAMDASRPVAGTSIAAHVAHVVFGMDVVRDWIRGDRTPRDWSESWRVRSVDDRAWTDLLNELRRAYTDLRQAIAERGTSDAVALGAAIGGIAHIAYHLGAVRQKLAVLRSG
jgi:hypothetical protein